MVARGSQPAPRKSTCRPLTPRRESNGHSMYSRRQASRGDGETHSERREKGKEASVDGKRSHAKRGCTALPPSIRKREAPSWPMHPDGSGERQPVGPWGDTSQSVVVVSSNDAIGEDAKKWCSRERRLGEADVDENRERLSRARHGDAQGP